VAGCGYEDLVEPDIVLVPGGGGTRRPGGGVELILAGHTHGGQVCVPGFGALTTNCDLPADRVKGLSEHHTEGHHTWLHVSAGIGTSPFAPYRFACPPEVTLLTLVGAQGSGS